MRKAFKRGAALQARGGKLRPAPVVELIVQS